MNVIMNTHRDMHDAASFKTSLESSCMMDSAIVIGQAVEHIREWVHPKDLRGFMMNILYHINTIEVAPYDRAKLTKNLLPSLKTNLGEKHISERNR